MDAQVKNALMDDGATLVWHKWKPEEERPRFLVHILHGMGEHGARYDRFACYLAGKGALVFIQDHRGHGLTAQANRQRLGVIAKEDGWNRLEKDSSVLDELLLARYPGVPLFLMGHSMGSFLARTVMERHPERFRGVVAMGSGCSLGLLAPFAMLIARSHIKKYGYDHPDDMLSKMAFGPYLKRIKPVRTQNDWLNRDAKEVDAYNADPLCGFTCSSSFYRDLFTGIATANDPSLIKAVPKDLPFLMISGDQDPVGGWGKGVEKAFGLYGRLTDKTLRLVPGARHELLNELEKDETYACLYEWMAGRL